MSRPLHLRSHLAGRAAYQRNTRATQKNTPAQPSSNKKAAATPASQTSKPVQKASTEASVQKAEGALTAQEQRVIEKQFPEAPELSMRLYGQSRGTETINPGAVGGRLDVTG